MAMIERLFTIIGMPRSGTTWLHQRLGRHSRMVRALGRIKEVHYFDQIYAEQIALLPADVRHRARRRDWFRSKAELRLERIDGLLDRADGDQKHRLKRERHQIRQFIHDYAASDQWYADLFAQRPDAWCLDSTPAYYRLPAGGLKHLLSRASEVRLVLLLRDPFDRALSGIRHRVLRQGLDWRGWDEQERTAFARLVIEDGRGTEEIRRLKSVVPDVSLRIIWFDQIRDRPEEAVAGALGHAGLDLEPACMEEAGTIPNPTPSIEISPKLLQFVHAETRQTVEGFKSLGLDLPSCWDRADSGR